MYYCVYRQRSSEKNDDYAKIREVTGINDYQKIKVAIKACQNNTGSYEIDEVINALITDECGAKVAAAVSKTTVASTPR